MNKKIEGAAPVSKYQAKRQKRIEEAMAKISETASINANKENAENAEEAKDAEVKETPETKENVTVFEVADKPAFNPTQDFNKRGSGKKGKNEKGLPSSSDNYPEHMVSVALLIKNNAEIRRFTALGILNYLLQKGEIKGEHRYVSFKWNKFAVKCNGLTREFSYNEKFFINALVASFASFSASAQRTIDIFCKKELNENITEAVSMEEMQNIVTLNEEYQDYGSSITED